MATITCEETTGTAALWFALLAPPFAWAAQLASAWLIGEVLACSPGSSFAADVAGVPVRVLTVAVNTALLAVTGAALVVALRCRARLSRGDGSTGRRASWMAVAAIINGVVFAAVIALAYAPSVLLGSCEAPS